MQLERHPPTRVSLDVVRERRKRLRDNIAAKACRRPSVAMSSDGHRAVWLRRSGGGTRSPGLSRVLVS